MASEQHTMTLNLAPAGTAALEEPVLKKELSKTAVIRQSQRLYQFIELRTSRGEKLVLADEKLQKEQDGIRGGTGLQL